MHIVSYKGYMKHPRLREQSLKGEKTQILLNYH